MGHASEGRICRWTAVGKHHKSVRMFMYETKKGENFIKIKLCIRADLYAEIVTQYAKVINVGADNEWSWVSLNVVRLRFHGKTKTNSGKTIFTRAN